jgi:DNA-binding response OmpR family regulator
MADRENELRGRRLGADDYVVKPVDFEVLHTIINDRLAGTACDRTRA